MQQSQHLDVVVHDVIVFDLVLFLLVLPPFVLADHATKFLSSLYSIATIGKDGLSRRVMLG